VEGAIARASHAAASRDARSLFALLDQRARNALASTVKARQRAVAVIQKSYPAEARSEALAQLGDGAQAQDGAGLFALRCGDPCMEEFAERLSAPQQVTREGPLTVVQTVRGERLELFHGQDGWYGLVWNTEALQRENTRAFAELDLIRQNAALYEKQRALK
jgi:hypothetical protein